MRLFACAAGLALAAGSAVAEVAQPEPLFEPQSRSIIGSSFPENGEYELVEFDRDQELDQEDGDSEPRSMSQGADMQSDSVAPATKSKPASVKSSSKRASQAKKPRRSAKRSSGSVVRRATAPVRKVIRKVLPF